MLTLESSNLVKYNANSRGSDVGDCTARSISLAFNTDYDVIKNIMNKSAKRGQKFNAMPNVEKVIKELGGGPFIKGFSKANRISVNDWVDEHPNGTYVIFCTKNGDYYGPKPHLVCALDGTLYDSWDSRTFYMAGYWEIPKGIKAQDITDIGEYLKDWITHKDSQGYKDYAKQVFDNIVGKNRKLKKLADEYGVDFTLTLNVTRVALVNYTFKFGYTISLSIPQYSIKDKAFEGKFAIVFTPTMDKLQVDDYFEETFYNKLYSFIHGIVNEIADICEGEKFLQNSNVSVPQSSTPYDPWDTFSRKSFNKLPHWVKRLATSFYRSNPFDGEEYDSVELTIMTPPFDTRYGEGTSYTHDSTTRTFLAYNMDVLNEMLEHYKKTGDYESTREINHYY